MTGFCPTIRKIPRVTRSFLALVSSDWFYPTLSVFCAYWVCPAILIDWAAQVRNLEKLLTQIKHEGPAALVAREERILALRESHFSEAGAMDQVGPSVFRLVLSLRGGGAECQHVLLLLFFSFCCCFVFFCWSVSIALCCLRVDPLHVPLCHSPTPSFPLCLSPWQIQRFMLHGERGSDLRCRALPNTACNGCRARGAWRGA